MAEFYFFLFSIALMFQPAHLQAVVVAPFLRLGQFNCSKTWRFGCRLVRFLFSSKG
jgi:hypothetical protein